MGRHILACSKQLRVCNCSKALSKGDSEYVSCTMKWFHLLRIVIVIVIIQPYWILLQLTASPRTTEESTRERWQFGALTNRKATSSNRDPSLTTLLLLDCTMII